MNIILYKEYLEIGKVVSTKGLKGEVVVECWCDTPEFLGRFKEIYFKKEKEKLEVLKFRVHKRNAVILFNKINDIDKAEALRGTILYINRKDIKLEEGRYFIQDLIGLDVIDIETNQNYGKITDVLKTGANDVYQVTDLNEKNYLVPVIKDVVINVDIKNNKVFIKPLRGIFDEV